MIINPAEIVRKDDEVRVQSLIEYAGRSELLWYSFDKSYEEYLVAERLDGFLVAVLMLAMQSGEDIVVRGAVSEKLLYNLTNYYMNICKLVIPSLASVRIIVQSLDDGKLFPSGSGVVTGFSGGVDSFCTIYDHLGDDVPSSYRITHLVFNNVGAVPNSLFQARYQLLREFSGEMAIDVVKIDSNLNEILKISFLSNHAPRNISAVLMLQKLFGKYYYSSAYSYERFCISRINDMSYADPAGIHLLSTETLECISTGAQYTRVEKTRRIAEMKEAQHWLNVCVSPNTVVNCSVCEKCCRVLFTLELLGKVEKFSSVFDLKRWDGVRSWYVVDTLLNFKKRDDPLTKEVVDLANEVGYRFKFGHRALALVVAYMPSPIYKPIRDRFSPVN